MPSAPTWTRCWAESIPAPHSNCCLAYRNRRPPWLPLWGSWLPRKGQTERGTRFDALMLLSHCGTLSVSLFG